MHALVVGALSLMPSPAVQRPPTSQRMPLRMGMFDGFAAAFANDDTLGEKENAGLSKGVKYHKITWRGPKPMFGDAPEVTSSAVAGQKLRTLAREAGVSGIEYSCGEGHCGVCDVMVNGKRAVACVAKAPAADCVIEYGGAVPARKAKAARPRPKASGGGAAAGKAAAEAQAEASLQQRLAAEIEASNSKKKGGWPFG